ETIRRDGRGRGLITITTGADDESAIIKIRDTGCGIADEIRNKIFDPLFTTKEPGKGTGQGLSIARAVIVEGHGGTIDLETEVNHGTVFTIRLPLWLDDTGEM